MKDGWREKALEALASDSQEERLERLRALGLIDAENNLTDKAQNWGRHVPHTLTADDESAA